MTEFAQLAVNIAIAPLVTNKENFAIWVTNAPYTGGYVHIDRLWSASLTAKWVAWQEMFSLQDDIHLPLTDSNQNPVNFILEGDNYGGQLMQELGVSLWEWLFTGAIGNSFAKSQGMAIAQSLPLRLRLDIRDPNLIPLPWEIMQPDQGKQAISLSEQILFSRTTHDVTPFNPPTTQEALKILLVLGAEYLVEEEALDTLSDMTIALEEESASLNQVIKESLIAVNSQSLLSQGCSQVDTLLKPTPEELISALDNGEYNIIFYAGHGEPGPDGGLLFLRPDAVINGTELAQVLVRNQVILAVFNACWGAQPALKSQKTVKRSSLAEVLLHHGVPAVLAMRDAIADQESLTFIQSFTKSLCQRKTIDQAVAIARQQLLTLYKFNQPAWTLPILYLHPEFSGELIKPLNQDKTELPTLLTVTNQPTITAYLSSLNEPTQQWRIHGGLMRVGRHSENDVIIPERWVSQKHAEIIYRDYVPNNEHYFLKDFSRFGTLVYLNEKWQKVLHQEIPLQSGLLVKFGSIQGQTFQFIIDIR